MTFRKATREDVPRMAEIIEQAKAYFKQQGIPQWQDGYPNEVSLRADIAKGWSFVVCDETDAIVGTAAIMVADEPGVGSNIPHRRRVCQPIARGASAELLHLAAIAL